MKKNLITAAISVIVILFLIIASGCAGCAACEAQAKATNDLKPHGMSVESGSFLGLPWSTTRSFWGDHPIVVQGGVASSGIGVNRGDAVPCDIYNAPDAIQSGSVGNVGHNQTTCPQGTRTTSSGWVDPQGPEYRAWSCRTYGSFNGVPCR